MNIIFIETLCRKIFFNAHSREYSLKGVLQAICVWYFDH